MTITPGRNYLRPVSRGPRACHPEGIDEAERTDGPKRSKDQSSMITHQIMRDERLLDLA